ncbi:hypothetical protein JTB14_012331 [Gonioctena quinquepunctata]|nr:hypothetical protein JTB14_012331 [Gonioctena quinquepunctata]
MKTENASTGDPVWTQSVELLSQETECLPIMGSCQVSSILQNLDPTGSEGNNQSLDLIILPPSDFKIPALENSYSLQNNYIILKESSATKIEKPKAVDSTKKKDNYEDMLYFVCNLCPFLCTKDTKITEHLENAHKNKTIIKLPELKCPACPNIFNHKMSLRSHLIHDHGVGNSDLSQIIQAVIYYSHKAKLKEKEAKLKVSVKDPEIGKKAVDSNSDSSLGPDNFETENVNENIHKTPEPKDAAKQPDSTAKYLDVRRTSKCDILYCKVRLQDPEKMAYHSASHSDEGFKCKECGEKSFAWKNLTSHLWRLHKIDMELFSCDKCEYKTYSLAKLNNVHKLIHSDVKGFSCNVCNKAFKNNKQLRNHKLTHRDKIQRPEHPCEDCCRIFSDRRQLKIHRDVVHKKLRPFLCSFCGYKGSSRSSLKMHIRQHTGEKPFSCPSCSYTTSDHNSLRRHKLRHTGHKPYKCSYCSYACIQSSTYKTHIKTKHPGMEKDLMFTCHECQFRSVNKDMYISHMITVHDMKP